MTQTFIKELETEEIDALGTLFTKALPHQFWVDTKYFVEQLTIESSTLASDQKHQFVKDQLKKYFEKDLKPVLTIFGETFLDIAIKLGCMWVTSKKPGAADIVSTVGTAAESNLESKIAEGVTITPASGT